MLNEVGFDEVKAKVIFPGMATIWESLAPQTLNEKSDLHVTARQMNGLVIS